MKILCLQNMGEFKRRELVQGYVASGILPSSKVYSDWWLILELQFAVAYLKFGFKFTILICLG
jgi:hypothetical protein